MVGYIDRADLGNTLVVSDQDSDDGDNAGVMLLGIPPNNARQGGRNYNHGIDHASAKFMGSVSDAARGGGCGGSLRPSTSQSGGKGEDIAAKTHPMIPEEPVGGLIAE